MKETKTHYKMYKKGKNWVFAAITVTTIGYGLLGINSEHAAAASNDATVTAGSETVSSNTSSSTQAEKTSEQATSSAKVTTSTSSSASDSDSKTNSSSSTQKVSNSQSNTTTSASHVSSTEAAVSSSAKSSTNADKTSSSQASSQSSQSSSQASSTAQSSSAQSNSSSQSETNKDTATKDPLVDTETNLQNGHYVANNDTWTYVDDQGNVVKGLKKIDGNVQYFDPQTGVQIKGEYVTVGKQTYYFDPHSGNAIAYSKTNGDTFAAYNADSSVAQQGFFTDQNGNTYYLESSTQYKIGLQEINKVTYYFGEDGILRKNTTQTIDGRLYCFASDGSAKLLPQDKLTESQASAKEVADFAAHNVAKSYDAQSFENTNGYLTADSWYVPKYILSNGQQWVASSASDFRPLLMAWWPSKQVQADYLNYMAGRGVVAATKTYSANDTSLELNGAVEAVQATIERALKITGNVTWLRDVMSKFVKEETIWNKESEDVQYYGLQLQGGFLAYQNSSLTPWANSDYRKLGFTPGYLDGKSNKDAEFLLANDIDNSNPTVQAEQLNWLYYLTNFGTITANNANANFDGIRVDAVDNVDADLLQIAADYFNAAYGTNQSDASANKHLSILEDWGMNDPAYISEHGASQLTMDNYMGVQLNSSLTNAQGQNDKMARFVQWFLINRTNDDTEDTAIPNYSFVRAHDSNSQDQVRQAIQDATGKPYGQFTWADLEKGLELFYKDQDSTVKKYNKYNIPSAYAMLLTNKDTVPRVFYGDMYSEGGQYLSQKTIYYDTLTNLLKSRIKYVGGGQTMAVDQNDVLTSVRFGKGALNVTDQGTSETRTEGVGVIIANNTDLKLKDGEQVVLHMGAAHKNQAFRAAVLTTSTGLVNYENDTAAPVVYTDNNGDLIFTNKDLVVAGQTVANTAIQGVATPQVTGYLAVWVPVGAAAEQDARTAASDQTSTDGKVFHSNAALDSNVIFEGFSNFISYPQERSQYANIVIAQNAAAFKQLGITSFELAPQYRSSSDGSFLDSMIDNGYAFTDRYDLGFGTPTKYGTAADLRNAIAALHANGIQAIADWVPDQIYALPGQETVTVTRTDDHGNWISDSSIHDSLYVANTIGGGEYQNKYGGAFLAELQQKYPELFTKNQAVTGVPIDGSTKIKEWSAKYLNATNILGRGSEYVLKSNDNGEYFYVGTERTAFLPAVLVAQNERAEYAAGDSSQARYYTQLEDTAGHWYLIDPTTGTKQTGFQKIIDQNKVVYYNNAGQMQYGQQKINGQWYLFDSYDGAMKTGLQSIKGQNKTVYYNDKGQMQYGQQKINDSWYLFDGYTGAMKTGWQYLAAQNKLVHYATNGQMQHGQQKIDGRWYYFDTVTGSQKFGLQYLADQNKTVDYGSQGWMQYGQQKIDGQWYLFDSYDGAMKTGLQYINGQNKTVYYNAKGQMQYGQQKIGDNWYLFDGYTGAMKTGWQYLASQNKLVHYASNGQMQYGQQKIDGRWYYFDTVTGSQKFGLQYLADQHKTVFYGDQGQIQYGQQKIDGQWYLFDSYDGAMKTGLQYINGQNKTVYYNTKGQMQYGQQKVGDNWYLFDGYTGAMKTGWQYLANQNKLVHYASNGQMQYGQQKINGRWYYFDTLTGAQKFGLQYLADQNKTVDYGSQGWMQYGQQKIGNDWYLFDDYDGAMKTGWQYLAAQNKTVYYNESGKMVYGQQKIDGKVYNFDTVTGALKK
ncbi:glycoside hydrolase family 70 protein [Liquorilactobacillus satsumensis]|uniref:glycoside hydrolase family 70 protein n=2 Tax=Liquorilactobacillus satsumensis TaxID=259059 RepID=UPI001E621EFE|nr:glycoside hydrolase family 70 protein [Liquorilactobacillus satsumensis]